jgi:myo-inositol-1(or 4)-monophosphatase
MELHYIPTFLKAAEAGAVVLKKYFGQTMQLTEKTHLADVRTKADLESEAAILPILESAFPDFDIHSEENGRKVKDSDYTIVVDPLDGTHNFTLGIPNFTILIALLYKKRSVAGLIYHPLTQAAYYAEEGRGAYLNGQRIHVNTESDSTHATVAYIPGYQNAGRQLGLVASALFGELHIKRLLYSWSGAADASVVACGRAEAMIYDGNEIYDYSASKIICREAGAKITDIDGKPEPDDLGNCFLVSNGTALHEQILAAWRKVRS